ncbi:MAG: monovalent cation/H+ antiporter subunit D family protein [Dethiobacter sp.]|jgi:multicomponent Na+:H+ antiporter subunit D|nr:monovalent cation/H+ antiporter subunit D family protein [Dethiobacter sp.]MBS3989820.1 monovalent cation/H+ antiporter subunit D family protein [Dethiobacter sp.]
MDYLPLYSVVIPLLAAGIMLLCCRSESAVSLLALIGSALSFAASAGMLPALANGQTLGTVQGYLSFPLHIYFRADGVSIFFGVIFSFCFLLAIIYSLGYMRQGRAKLRYYALLLVAQSAILGVVMTSSLVGLFLFFEVLAVVSYLLVIHEEDTVTMSAGAKYLFMTIVAGFAIFFGLVVTYFLAGRLDYLSGGYVAASPLAGAALFAFLIGCGLKAGMFPLHIWLPDAHSAAPAPVSALLSGCMIKTGVYGLIRVLYYVYTPQAIQAVWYDQVLLWLAVATIFLGSALALQQDHLKRRLAYSSVAQIGYVLLGMALMAEQALQGAIFHVFSHALMKGTLFFCAGIIVAQTGKKYVSQLQGIGRQLPVTMLSFALAAVTIVGIPPFNAFFSKWHLASASLAAGKESLVALLIVSSLLNALYYFPIVVNAFFGEETEEEKTRTGRLEAATPRSMVCSTAVLALLCVLFAFVQPHWPMELARRIAAGIF